MLRLLFLLLSLSLTLASCSALKPSDFAGQEPVFDPLLFFTGRTESTGVMENRRGVPVKRVKTKTRGQWQDNVLHLEQELVFDDDPPTHRSWKLRRIDEHHFEGTANDMVGTARGEAHGPMFHWSFILAAKPGNPLANVRMSQWMHLQPDGRTMVNHTTITKAGIVLRQVTEQFRKAGP
ncbi:MAG: DUF3833 family protein [Prosthecobacter sp.]